ncbi:HNH endonuclease [Steroidobacter agaridevorans]|uniref:HNH endonuclease n=1 Tax=Steroidobacter agaridevorans TaxID=2695856 RepID=UPI001321F2FB|nr:HNH endonuclease [Steroidobacter agaridevorans]GFE87717.1 hypothetical protein GCM10011488_26710 [Steroidobacter agaridevorans]
MVAQHIKRAEAMRMLRVGSTKVHQLINTKQIRAKLVAKAGKGRYWAMNRADVMRLKERGFLVRKPARQKMRIAWERAHGVIPNGFTVFAIDGNRTNISLDNLACKPLASTVRRAEAKTLRKPRAKKPRNTWTAAMTEILRRDFPTKRSKDIARDLGVALATITRQARIHKFRKDHVAIKARNSLNALPIGTERVHDTRSNIVLIKVATVGKFHGEQWRPKQAVVWEQANSRKLPKNARVIFKDGNKRNFDPSNLHAFMSREEHGAAMFATFHGSPKPVQQVIKLVNKAKLVIRGKRDEFILNPTKPAAPTARVGKRGGYICKRWTPEMDEILARDYPSGSLETLQHALNMPLNSIRQRARRKGLRRSLEAMQAMVAEVRAKAAAGAYA